MCHRLHWITKTPLILYCLPLVFIFVSSCDSRSPSNHLDLTQILCSCSGSVPGLLSCPYLTDDRLHPHDLISNHAEEPQLVCLCGDLHPTLLAGRQQLLPALHHFVLAAGDSFGLLTSVHSPQLGRALLQLTHLAEREELILGKC